MRGTFVSVVGTNTLLRLRVLKATMLIRCAATASRGRKGTAGEGGEAGTTGLEVRDRGEGYEEKG